MGVLGLTQYVNRKDSFWEKSVELQNTRVIIDGNALLYHLYFNDGCKLDYKSGGQYKKFHDNIVTFFERLKENEVDAYVILDGASDPSGNKFKTSVERLKLKIRRALNCDPKAETLPQLARQTFVQAMENLCGKRFVVSDL